jgi:hypothetical protein
MLLCLVSCRPNSYNLIYFQFQYLTYFEYIPLGHFHLLIQNIFTKLGNADYFVSPILNNILDYIFYFIFINLKVGNESYFMEEKIGILN